MLKIIVTRKLASLSYLRDPRSGFDWHNNDANDSLDSFTLQDADTEETLFSCRAQTVANLEGLDPGVHFYDTLAPGPFRLRAFVDPRAFKCQPHGIVGAVTKHGDQIGDDSTTPANKSRWLMHNWMDHNGADTRVAWSAGCIVVPDADLDRFNALLSERGVQAGELIEGMLFEEGDS